MSIDTAADLLVLSMTLGNAARVALAARYWLDPDAPRGTPRRVPLDASVTAGRLSEQIPQRWNRTNPTFPAKAGNPGKRRNAGRWVPAFAGTAVERWCRFHLTAGRLLAGEGRP